MQPNQLFSIAAAAWRGPALCSFCGIWVSQSISSSNQGGTDWYVSISLATGQPTEGPHRNGFTGFAPCPFEALRAAFRALRATAPGFAFAALCAVSAAESDYVGQPAHV